MRWAELADDALILARLHDRELDAATLTALRQFDFPANLFLQPRSAAACSAWQALGAAIGAVSPEPTFVDLDLLAAEYAAIYLTGAGDVSPCESFWVDSEHLLYQQPMLDLRETYRAAGLASENWRRRPDDHLVLQLLYLAHALRGDAPARGALAAFLDAHLLRWLPRFAERVAKRADRGYHALLIALTSAWCQGLRDELPAHDTSHHQIFRGEKTWEA